jgi:hypothetical protein
MYRITNSFLVITKNDWLGRQAVMFLTHHAHALFGAHTVTYPMGWRLICGYKVAGAGSYNFVMCCKVIIRCCSNYSALLMISVYL